MAEIVAGYYDHNDHEQAAALYCIFGILDDFDFDLADQKLRFDIINLGLKPGIKEEILNLFLDKELKHIYNCSLKEIEYTKMNSELPVNESNPKRLKM
jgi:hypothetical protein